MRLVPPHCGLVRLARNLSSPSPVSSSGSFTQSRLRPASRTGAAGPGPGLASGESGEYGVRGSET